MEITEANDNTFAVLYTEAELYEVAKRIERGIRTGNVAINTHELIIMALHLVALFEDDH